VLGEGVFEVMRSIIDRGRAQVVVATAGAQGAYSLQRGSDEIRHTACAQLDLPVVDSNGAGDAFSSSFLHAWFDGADVEACMRIGTIGGAFACAWHGTAERSLGLDELTRFVG
ncbi:MAG: PfkB family carbohydrate kinase, partial [Gammaproteobacteria bacterium]